VPSPFDAVDFESWLAGSTESARVAVPLILEAIAPRSVVDVGCGLGAWLAVFEEDGVGDVLGYDGPWVDRSKLLVDPGAFRVANLEQPLDASRRFDLALCLEVAQLLEPRHASQLVETLVSLADVVVFSAAIPGQGGIHHVNAQWPRYWAELFGARGYVPSDPFRAALWEREGVKWWFAQNMVCFVEPAALARLPVLAGGRCDTAPPPLVHPGCLLSCTEALEAAAHRVPLRKGGLWRRLTS
jgi:SAM-dependent methyltransferase